VSNVLIRRLMRKENKRIATRNMEGFVGMW